MRRKIQGIVMMLLLLNLIYTFSVAAEEKAPEIVGNHAITIDAYSKDVLYEKNANEKALPASVTKVMTALLLMENIKEDESITISEKCINMDRSNSQILFKAGEQLARNEALFTMMTISANDIACAIGEHISGSEESFAKKMTERAKELGAVETKFQNASGLHHEEHYTTAHDLALIGVEAIKHESILKAMGTKEYSVTTNLQTDKRIVNPSKIHDDPDALGGKTGYTNQARNTLMKIDEKDGIRVLNVILGNNNRINKYNIYEDIKKISDYGISKLEKELVVDKTKWTKNLTILEKSVLVKPEKSLYLTKKKSDTSSYKLDFVPVELDKDLLYSEGITKSQKLGEIKVLKGNEVIDTIDALADSDAVFEKPKKVIIPFWIKVLLSVLIPIGAYAGFVIVHNYKYFNHKKRPV